MNESYRLRLFGRAEIVDGNGTIHHLDSRKAVALLGYLARHNRPLAREQLADLLWSDKSEMRGRRNLSRELSEISAKLPGFLQTTYHTVQLNTEHTWVDIIAFEELSKKSAQEGVRGGAYPPLPSATLGRETSAASPFARELIEGWRPADTWFSQAVRPGINANQLAQAVDLYRGEFMAGFYLDGCADFESWLIREREFWQREATEALEQLMMHHALHHQDTQAIALARRCLELEPWQEDAHRTLMLLLARNGKRIAALAQYDACRRALENELGVEPTEETRALYEQIKNNQVAKWQGDREFKQQTDSHTVFPSTARDRTNFAPLPPKTEHSIEPVPPTATILTRQPLPRAATRFIGRQRELQNLIAWLRAPDTRFVSIMALGGMGKTRLALAAAEQLAQQHAFRDGVAFADLSSIDTTAELALTLAQALGLPFDNHGASPRRQLLDYLQSKQLLLLLDNCEHHLGGLAELVASILQEASEVSLLVTSRQRLGLGAERVLTLGGMDASDDGAALFAANARHARPDFELNAQSRPLVEEICTRLSGMPLAIELAARWMNTLSLAAIDHELAHNHDLLATRSRDTAERHCSVRAVYEATWARLSPSDQAMFAQVAVFRGGATRQAIRAVTGATLWQLQTLVEQALIRFDPRRERYAVHELLRQYTEQRLENDIPRERATRERHATYFLKMLADCESALKSALQWKTLATISADIENLRAAWRWAAETRSLDLLIAATEALSLTYAWLGHHEEGLRAMGLAAEAMRGAASQSSAALATILAAQARFALLCSDRTQAFELLSQAQALLAVDDGGAATDAAMARVLLQLGRCLAHQDYTAARTTLSQSKALWEALGDRWGVTTAQAELGYLLTDMRLSYSEAKILLEQSAIGFRALGDQIGLSETLMYLCRANRNIGLFPQALAIARDVYDIATMSGNSWLLAQAGSNLGTMLVIGHEYQEAYTTLSAALNLTQELGQRSKLPNLYSSQGYAASFLGNYTEARNAYNHGLRIVEQINDELERCSLLSSLAGTALAEGAYIEALGLADEALALSDQLGEGSLRSRTLPYRALAMRGLSRGDRGRRDALETLRLGLTARSEILVALWAVALLLADAGETTRAAEVFALSERKRHLDNAWQQDIALRELRTLIAALPPQVAAQAQARWAQHDTWVALEELCIELEEAWPSR